MRKATRVLAIVACYLQAMALHMHKPTGWWFRRKGLGRNPTYHVRTHEDCYAADVVIYRAQEEPLIWVPQHLMDGILMAKWWRDGRRTFWDVIHLCTCTDRDTDTKHRPEWQKEAFSVLASKERRELSLFCLGTFAEAKRNVRIRLVDTKSRRRNIICLGESWLTPKNGKSIRSSCWLPTKSMLYFHLTSQRNHRRPGTRIPFPRFEYEGQALHQRPGTSIGYSHFECSAWCVYCRGTDHDTVTTGKSN